MAEQTPLHESTSKAGAVFGEESGWTVPLHYGDAADEYERTRRANGLFDLSWRSKVEVSGPESATFLHNLCTNDVLNLPFGSGCEFFLTTNKAKVVAHGYAYHVRLSDNRPAFWLDLPANQAEPVIRHLDDFVI